MDHVFWIYRDEVAGRPGPLEAPWRLSELRQGGFDTILSVASDLFPHSEVIASGLSRTCIPFPDVLPPDAQTVSICKAHLRLTLHCIKTNIDSGRKVLVHCAGGKDRAGLVLAHYMAERDGLTAATAVSRLREIRPQALSAEGWEAMALKLIGSTGQEQI